VCDVTGVLDTCFGHSTRVVVVLARPHLRKTHVLLHPRPAAAVQSCPSLVIDCGNVLEGLKARPPLHGKLHSRSTPLAFAGDFKHIAVDMYLTEVDGEKVLKVDYHSGKRKGLASLRTVISHVQVRHAL
jgi:hypothetical protein